MGSLTRRSLLAAGAVMGGVALLPRLPRAVAAAGADATVLANLVLLEDQAAYVARQVAPHVSPPTATAGGPVSPLSVITTLGSLHETHRDSFIQALLSSGGTAPTTGTPWPALVPAGTGQDEALAALQALENGLLGALYGAIPALTTRELRAAAATVLAPTARIAALVAAARGQSPVPQSFVTGSAAAATAVAVGGSAAAAGATNGGGPGPSASAPASGGAGAGPGASPSPHA